MRRPHLVAVEKSFECVVTDRLEQPVPHRAVAFLGDDQRLRHELIDEIDHVEGIDPGGGAQSLGCLQREAADEHAEAAEHSLRGRVEEVIAPVDGCLQRSLSSHRAAGASGEQPEALVEHAGELLDAQAAESSGR